MDDLGEDAQTWFVEYEEDHNPSNIIFNVTMSIAVLGLTFLMGKLYGKYRENSRRRMKEKNCDISNKLNKNLRSSQSNEQVLSTSDSQTYSNSNQILPISKFSQNCFKLSENKGVKFVEDNTKEKLFCEKFPLPISSNPTKKEAEMRVKLEEKEGKIIKTEKHQIRTEYDVNDLSSNIENLKEFAEDKEFVITGTEKENTCEVNYKFPQREQKSSFIKIQDKSNSNYFSETTNSKINGKINRNLPKSYSERHLSSMQLSHKSSLSQHHQSDLFETGRFNKVFENPTIIGRGGFGEVYKATQKMEKNTYAIKKIYFLISRNEKVQDHKYFREVQSLTPLEHPNIIRFFNMWVEDVDENFANAWEKFKEMKLSRHLQKIEIPKKKYISVKSKSKRIGAKEKSSSVSAILQENSRKDLKDVSNRTSLGDFGFDWESGSKKIEEIEESDEEDESFVSSIQESEEFAGVTKYIGILENMSHKKDLINSFPIVLHIQMLYCPDHTLKDFFQERNVIDEKESFLLFRDIIRGLSFIHSLGIIHRDLKPSNIFREKKENGFKLRIGDFGLSTKLVIAEENGEGFSNSKPNLNTTLTQNIGTPMYLAPELEKGTKYNGKIDIYSLGLILFELLVVIRTRHEHDNLFKALKEKSSLPSGLEELYPKECRLIKWMTQNDAENRANVTEIEESPDYLDLEKEFGN